ncbi:MAG: hypothetical protein SFU87_19890 [Chitinophagaceae bacterium]|nr:hypothetical protein [Chitinophagaceae bacterium]
MLTRIKSLIKKDVSFAFETTLSGLTYLKHIQHAKSWGYIITLLFIYVSTFELAINWVAVRVSKGGHNIPADVIQRSFKKGIRNFQAYTKGEMAVYIR